MSETNSKPNRKYKKIGEASTTLEDKLMVLVSNTTSQLLDEGGDDGNISKKNTKLGEAKAPRKYKPIVDNEIPLPERLNNLAMTAQAELISTFKENDDAQAKDESINHKVKAPRKYKAIVKNPISFGKRLRNLAMTAQVEINTVIDGKNTSKKKRERKYKKIGQGKDLSEKIHSLSQISKHSLENSMLGNISSPGTRSYKKLNEEPHLDFSKKLSNFGENLYLSLADLVGEGDDQNDEYQEMISFPDQSGSTQLQENIRTDPRSIPPMIEPVLLDTPNTIAYRPGARPPPVTWPQMPVLPKTGNLKYTPVIDRGEDSSKLPERVLSTYNEITSRIGDHQHIPYYYNRIYPNRGEELPYVCMKAANAALDKLIGKEKPTFVYQPMVPRMQKLGSILIETGYRVIHKLNKKDKRCEYSHLIQREDKLPESISQAVEAVISKIALTKIAKSEALDSNRKDKEKEVRKEKGKEKSIHVDDAEEMEDSINFQKISHSSHEQKKERKKRSSSVEENEKSLSRKSKEGTFEEGELEASRSKSKNKDKKKKHKKERKEKKDKKEKKKDKKKHKKKHKKLSSEQGSDNEEALSSREGSQDYRGSNLDIDKGRLFPAAEYKSEMVLPDYDSPEDEKLKLELIYLQRQREEEKKKIDAAKFIRRMNRERVERIKKLQLKKRQMYGEIGKRLEIKGNMVGGNRLHPGQSNDLDDPSSLQYRNKYKNDQSSRLSQISGNRSHHFMSNIEESDKLEMERMRISQTIHNSGKKPVVYSLKHSMGKEEKDRLIKEAAREKARQMRAKQMQYGQLVSNGQRFPEIKGTSVSAVKPKGYVFKIKHGESSKIDGSQLGGVSTSKLQPQRQSQETDVALPEFKRKRRQFSIKKR